MRSNGKTVIDIHNHPNWHGHDVDALVRNMDEYGIEKTWLLSWEINHEEFNAAPVYHEHMDRAGCARRCGWWSRACTGTRRVSSAAGRRTRATATSARS